MKVITGEFFKPIRDIPDRLKSGAEVLGFNENATRRYQKFMMFYSNEHAKWYSLPGHDYVSPTHYAEVE